MHSGQFGHIPKVWENLVSNLKYFSTTFNIQNQICMIYKISIVIIYQKFNTQKLRQHSVGVDWSFDWQWPGNTSKQHPNRHQTLIQMLLNPDWWLTFFPADPRPLQTHRLKSPMWSHQNCSNFGGIFCVHEGPHASYQDADWQNCFSGF